VLYPQPSNPWGPSEMFLKPHKHVVACEDAFTSQSEAAVPGAGTTFGIHMLPSLVGASPGIIWLAEGNEEGCCGLARFPHCIPHGALRALAGSPSLASTAHTRGLHLAKLNRSAAAMFA